MFEKPLEININDTKIVTGNRKSFSVVRNDSYSCVGFKPIQSFTVRDVKHGRVFFFINEHGIASGQLGTYVHFEFPPGCR